MLSLALLVSHSYFWGRKVEPSKKKGGWNRRLALKASISHQISMPCDSPKNGSSGIPELPLCWDRTDVFLWTCLSEACVSSHFSALGNAHTTSCPLELTTHLPLPFTPPVFTSWFVDTHRKPSLAEYDFHFILYSHPADVVSNMLARARVHLPSRHFLFLPRFLLTLILYWHSNTELSPAHTFSQKMHMQKTGYGICVYSEISLLTVVSHYDCPRVFATCASLC